MTLKESVLQMREQYTTIDALKDSLQPQSLFVSMSPNLRSARLNSAHHSASRTINTTEEDRVTPFRLAMNQWRILPMDWGCCYVIPSLFWHECVVANSTQWFTMGWHCFCRTVHHRPVQQWVRWFVSTFRRGKGKSWSQLSKRVFLQRCANPNSRKFCERRVEHWIRTDGGTC